MTTKEQVIAMAKQAGGTEMQPYDYGAKPDRFIIQHEALERFARLVGNAKLEEARVLVWKTCCNAGDEFGHGYNKAAVEIERAIDALKEPTT